jgi:hypothetical protein
MNACSPLNDVDEKKARELFDAREHSCLTVRITCSLPQIASLLLFIPQISTTTTTGASAKQFVVRKQVPSSILSSRAMSQASASRWNVKSLEIATRRKSLLQLPPSSEACHQRSEPWSRREVPRTMPRRLPPLLLLLFLLLPSQILLLHLKNLLQDMVDQRRQLL